MEDMNSKRKKALSLRGLRSDDLSSYEKAKEVINSRKMRKHQVLKKIANNTYIGILRDTILLTGGIGDVFALESHFSSEQRQRLKTILYATNKSKFLIELFSALPNYPNLTNHRILWNDFSKFWCFVNKEEVQQVVIPPDQEFIGAEDWSIASKFPPIGSGSILYSGSSFLMYRLCDIETCKLPRNYAVVQPCSTDKRTGTRDFTDDDWKATIYWLKKRNLKGVVINSGNDAVPCSEEIIDMSNKTTLLEAIEVLKRASGYIGIDSWLTVLATKLFEDNFLAIKSTNNHCYNNKHVYFSPKKTFDFLGTDIPRLVAKD